MKLIQLVCTNDEADEERSQERPQRPRKTKSNERTFSSTPSVSPVEITQLYSSTIATVIVHSYRIWSLAQPPRPIPQPDDLGEATVTINPSTQSELGFFQAAFTASFAGLMYPDDFWYQQITAINSSVGFNITNSSAADLYNHRLPFGHLNNATLKGNTEQYTALTKTGVGALVMFSFVSFLLAAMLAYGTRGVETTEWPGDWVRLFDGDMERIVKFRDDRM
ncbi:hypothetical protein T439DRAFT_361159 [Meredithblackwellia eburnea MCA 4105]